jgi:hypothetical protein
MRPGQSSPTTVAEPGASSEAPSRHMAPAASGDDGMAAEPAAGAGTADGRRGALAPYGHVRIRR